MLTKLALKAETFFARFRRHKSSLQIVPYIGYASQHKAFLHGRILRNKPLPRITEHDTIWHNLANTYRRFDTDEVPNVSVHITLEDQTVEVTTNEEGFFQASLPLTTPLTKHNYEVKYRVENVETTGSLINAGNQASFGVISDLDDTVLKTQVLDPLQMLQNTFFQNAHKRLPFAGVAAFYRALHKDFNPIHYVSSSPWNLHDVLTQFFEIRNIPKGAIFLQDYGLESNQLIIKAHDAHKLFYIKQVMEDFAPLPFILIGDSSQDDPFIYRQIIEDYPGRILAVYIRDVGTKREPEELQKLIHESTQVDILLVKDTYEAAEHAHSRGFLTAEDLEKIHQEMEEDKTGI